MGFYITIPPNWTNDSIGFAKWFTEHIKNVNELKEDYMLLLNTQ